MTMTSKIKINIVGLQTNYHKVVLLILLISISLLLFSCGTSKSTSQKNKNRGSISLVESPESLLERFIEANSIEGKTNPNISDNKKNAFFSGGIGAFYTFFVNEFKVPQDNLESTIRISFIIETDGLLTYIKPQIPISINLENEIIRVLKLSPKWEPAETNGQKIPTVYVFPLSLRYQ